jgi:folylpolyglutamate synthase/dihydropteroate synthase
MSADAFLASLTNWEAQGIPDSAGSAAGGGAGVFDLQRMHVLLECLGSPHRGRPVVHVAGTKGKGSVAAMVSATLRAAGHRVGTYTSPHMFHVRGGLAVACGAAVAEC